MIINHFKIKMDWLSNVNIKESSGIGTFFGTDSAIFSISGSDRQSTCPNGSTMARRITLTIIISGLFQILSWSFLQLNGRAMSTMSFPRITIIMQWYMGATSTWCSLNFHMRLSYREAPLPNSLRLQLPRRNFMKLDTQELAFGSMQEKSAVMALLTPWTSKWSETPLDKRQTGTSIPTVTTQKDSRSYSTLEFKQTS